MHGEPRNPARGTLPLVPQCGTRALLTSSVIGTRSRRCFAGRYSSIPRIGRGSRTAAPRGLSDPAVACVRDHRQPPGGLLFCRLLKQAVFSYGPGDLPQPDRQPGIRGGLVQTGLSADEFPLRAHRQGKGTYFRERAPTRRPRLRPGLRLPPPSPRGRGWRLSWRPRRRLRRPRGPGSRSGRSS